MSAVGKHSPALSLKVLSSVARLLSASADRPAGLRGVLEVLREALGADHCAVLLLDGRAATLAVAFHAASAGNGPHADEVAAASSLSGEVLNEGRLLLVGDVAASGQSHLAAGEGVPAGAYIGVPLTSCAKVLGVLRATRLAPDWDLAAEQRECLSIAAELIASAVSLEQQALGTGAGRGELADVVENLHQAIVTVDGALKVRLWNRRFLSLLCLPTERICAGKGIATILPQLLWRQVECNVEDTAEYGSETRMQFDLGLPGGEVLPIEVRTAPLDAGASARRGVLIMLTDMSLQRELAKLRRLEDLEVNFLSMVSHELRTPLTSIKGATGILAAGGAADPDQCGELLRIVQNNTERLIRLVDDLLDVSTIEHNALTLNVEPLDMRALLDAAMADATPLAARKECTLHAGLIEVTVRGDDKRLRQVFAQLLGNAVKFSRRGGEITVRLTADDGMARATFRDSGHGIPGPARDRVFDKFYQVEDPMTRSAGGTGIGLFIAKAIVDAHGGRISVLDSGDWGTEMAVELPLLQTDPERPREADGARWSAH